MTLFLVDIKLYEDAHHFQNSSKKLFHIDLE